MRTIVKARGGTVKFVAPAIVVSLAGSLWFANVHAAAVPAASGAGSHAHDGSHNHDGTSPGETKPPMEDTLVPCQQLAARSGDAAKEDTPRHTVIDEERGLLQINYTTGTEYKIVTIDYRNDQACQEDSATRDLIAHAIEASQSVKKEQCPSLIELQTSGASEIKDGKKINREALSRYIAETCSK